MLIFLILKISFMIELCRSGSKYEYKDLAEICRQEGPGFSLTPMGKYSGGMDTGLRPIGDLWSSPNHLEETVALSENGKI
jgi:hypothetical protein